MLGRTPRRPRPLHTAALGAAAALVLSLVLTAATVAAADNSSTGAVVKTRKTSIGTILVDTRGRTLYRFMRDKRDKSSCSGQCAAYWPPLTTSGKPVAGAGAKASLLGTTRRSDGHMQVTYNGHPLYHFAQDAKAGQTSGEAVSAFGGTWYAVSSSGAQVVPSASTGGGYGGGGYGGGALGG